jgi:hypothetical protein
MMTTTWDGGPDPDDDRYREIEVTPETPSDDDGGFTREESAAIGVLVALITIIVLFMCYAALEATR